MDIDDDNAPAPENIPTPSNDSGNQIFYSLGHDRVCQHCQVGDQNNVVFLFNISRHNGIPSILQTFEILFPKVYVEEVIIREINKRIQENKLTFGEFLIWIGLWFFIGTTHFGD